jgi:DNA-binding NtrC family response regulator
LPAVDAGATRTVMVVDDELPVLRAAKAMLERLGYQVVMANGGREAICTYRERMSEIDLVLMDMAMPELSGVEVYHELQNLNPNVHVVFSSGYREEEALTDMSQHALFLHKPYDLKRIDAVMKEAFPSLPEAKPVDPSIDES